MADPRGLIRRGAVPALLGLAGTAVVLAGLLSSGDGRGQGTGTPGSSFATVPEGAKAAYLLLERLGHKVERQAHPLSGFGQSQLAFFLAPEDRLDNADATALATWLEHGGTLVYGAAAFDPAAPALHQALGLPELVLVPRSEWVVNLSKEFAPARSLAVHVTVMVKDRAVEHVEAVAKGGTGQTVALRVNKGSGHLYVLDARVFSNAGLKQADNALFLATLASRHSQGQPIVFDEFVHGFGEMTSVLTIARWPLRWGLGLGGLALLCYALATGRRLGAVAAAPRPARRASIEQIEILATFLAAKKDRGPALAALAAWTGAAAPAQPPSDDSAFVSAARALQLKGSRWP